VKPGDPDPLAEKVRSAALAMQRQSWEQGVLAQAFFEEERDELVVLMSRASLMYLTKDGVPAALGGASVDPLMGGEALRRAAQLTGDLALHQAVDRMLEYVLQRAPRAPDGAIYHTGETVWSDSFFASARFLAGAGYFDEALHQVECLRRRLWHPRKHLLAHIWNEPQQALSEPRCWGGGNGWAAAALPQVIRAVPEDRPVARTRLVAFLRELIDGCRRTSARMACFMMWWTTPILSLRPTSPRCSPTRSTRAFAAAGCPPIISVRPITCAPRPAPKWIGTDSCKALPARPPLTAPAFRPRDRRFS
jgi:rhamnogalacturonyl hydrolase YesR